MLTNVLGILQNTCMHSPNALQPNSLALWKKNPYFSEKNLSVHTHLPIFYRLLKYFKKGVDRLNKFYYKRRGLRVFNLTELDVKRWSYYVQVITIWVGWMRLVGTKFKMASTAIEEYLSGACMLKNRPSLWYSFVTTISCS